MRVLVGYSYFPKFSVDIKQRNEDWLGRLRKKGFEVEGFCLTLNPPGPRLSWKELDYLWKTKNSTILLMYENLLRKLESFDVFLNYNGINIHPEFVKQIPQVTAYACFDDPESSEDLSKPVAAAYDLSLVGNIAAVEMYKSWGVKNAFFWPIGFRDYDFDPSLTYEAILNSKRQHDVTLLCERTSPWRAERLDKFVNAFPKGVYYGPGWANGFLPEEKRIPLLQQTKIGINIHNSTGPINFRTYYLPANGVMQICDNKSYLGKIFKLGEEVVGYDTIEEAIELTKFYIANDEERKRIAANGWKRVIKDYNEAAVFELMLKYVNEVERKIAKKIESKEREKVNSNSTLNISKQANAESIAKHLEGIQWKSKEEIEKLQLERLKNLLIHAFENVEYYNSLFKRIGFNPYSFSSFEQFTAIPVLTKEDIQKNFEKLQAKNFLAQDVFKDSTGGSTGNPMSFLRDKVSQLWFDLAAHRFRRWIGYNPSDKLGLIWGADRDVPSAFPPNERWLNSFNLTSKKIDSFVEEIKTFKPKAIRGYASSLYYVASYLKESGYKFSSPLTEAIESSAEKMWDYQRQTVEDVFGCKVFNMYGSREIPSIACECNVHNGMHIFSDLRYLELIKNGLPVSDREEGSIVITDLINYAMPLIRYEIGDVGVLSNKQCKCGRGFPLLTEVKGRIANTIITPDNKMVHGEFFTHLFYNVEGISSFQVKQDKIDELQILIKALDKFNPDTMEEIVAKIKNHLGNDISVSWSVVDEIPKTKSGKHHFVISNVEKNFIGKSTQLVENNSYKIKLLFFYDEEGWAWWLKINYIKKYISPRFIVEAKKLGEDFNHNDYDFIVYFGGEVVNGIENVPANKVVVGCSAPVHLDKTIRLIEEKKYLAGFVNSLEMYLPVRDKNNFFLCQNGVDEELFYPAKKRPKSLTACWVGHSGSIGNKGLDIVRQVCKQLNIKLVTLDRYAVKQKSELFTREQVRDEIYHKSSFYLCASETEGTPNPALESFACGLPVISTRVGNMPEIIVDGYNGFLVDRTVESFAEAIRKLKKLNLSQLSDNARKSILQEWTWKSKVKNYEQMFLELKERENQKIVLKENKDIPISFCIITNGKKPKELEAVIRSIKYQKIPEYEIIVVGKYNDREDVKYIPAIEEAEVGNLSALRNKAVENCKYDFITILDDDIILSKDWYNNLKNYNENYDILTSQVRLPDGSRYWDYATINGPRGHIILEEWEKDDYTYMTGGGGWIIRKNAAQQVKWDEERKFYQSEDSDFSQRCRDAGFKIKHNHKMVVFHADPVYTLVGRSIVRRKEGRTQNWVNAKLNGMNPDAIKELSVNLINNNLIAEAADALRYGLSIYKDNALLQEQWNFILSNFNGQITDSYWYSTNYPDYLSSLTEYLSPEELVSFLKTKEIDRKVIWASPIFNPSGYASEAISYALGLDKYVNLQVIHDNNLYSQNFVDNMPVHWKEKLFFQCNYQPKNKSVQADSKAILISHQPAPGFKRFDKLAYNIGRTMFETDSVPASWIPYCLDMNEIWVPSEFNVETFSQAGIPKEKLFVIPEAIDTDVFNPGKFQPLELTNKAKFNFLSIFEWTERKGAEILLRAYFESFSNKDDVCLYIRTYLLGHYDGDTSLIIQKKIDEIITRNGYNKNTLPKYVLLSEQLPFEDMIRLYKSVDCFVLPSRGEGWGRPYQEAMAMGLPVIGTNWSGNTAFMTNENSYLIDIDGLVEINGMEIPFYNGQKWANPSIKHLKKLMKEVHSNPERAKEVGNKARKEIIEKYSIDAVAKIVVDRLKIIEEKLDKGETPVKINSVKTDKIVVRWEGSQFANHSLAVVNREICTEISDDIELNLIPNEKNKFLPSPSEKAYRLTDKFYKNFDHTDITLRHYWPPNLIPPKDGRWVVIQPWEFGSLPASWANVFLNYVDEMWVPSNYVRQVYIDSGIPAERVFVVPNGYNPEKFHPGVKPYKLKTKKKFKFLFLGGTIYRKGIDVLIEAYTKTFSKMDEVCLVIKDMCGDSFYKGQTYKEQISKAMRRYNAPEIEYIDEILSEQDLVGLYTACDVLVHPYRGEGFGLPILEAMACGLPVIVTRGGACLDFCNEDNSLFVDAYKKPLPDKKVSDMPTVGQPWLFEPVMESLSKEMKYAVNNRQEIKKLGENGAKHALENWTWKHSALRAEERIKEIVKKPVLRFAPSEEVIVQMFAVMQDNFNNQNFPETIQQAILIEDMFKSHPILQSREKLLHDVLLLKGYGALGLSDLENAKISFEQALNLNPTSFRACAGLGKIFYNLEMYEASKTMIEWALKYSDNDSLILENLKEINNKLGFEDQHNGLVEAMQQKIIKAENLIEQKDFDTAENLLLEALSYDEKNIDALNDLSVVKILKNEYQEASDIILKVIEIDSTNEVALENLDYLQKIIESKINV